MTKKELEVLLFCETNEIRKDLLTLIKWSEKMSAELDALSAQVATNTSAIDKAIALINAGTGTSAADLATIADLTAKIKASDDALAAVAS